MMRLLCSFLLLGLLAGCALSPQQVTISPALPAESSNIGQGASLRLAVIDQRPTPVLGSRGGVYGDRSQITSANDVSEAIFKVVETQMRGLGYQVDAGSNTELKVIVDTFSYQHPDQASFGYDLELLCILRAEVDRGGEVYQGRYQVKSNRQFFNAPSASHNEELLNELLSQTLERMFADAKLQAFILK